VENGEACTAAKRKAKSRAAAIVKSDGGAARCNPARRRHEKYFHKLGFVLMANVK
jgi:hypothetical protein